VNRREFIPSLLAAVPLLLGAGFVAFRGTQAKEVVRRKVQTVDCYPGSPCEECRRKEFTITTTARTLDDAEEIAEIVRGQIQALHVR